MHLPTGTFSKKSEESVVLSIVMVEIDVEAVRFEKRIRRFLELMISRDAVRNRHWMSIVESEQPSAKKGTKKKNVNFRFFFPISISNRLQVWSLFRT